MATNRSYYISFANKYYTLWDVEVTNYVVDGYSYDIVNAVYIKNISMDKDVVLQLYPNTPWDTNLQGHSMRYKTNEKCIIPPHSFINGKYRGMLYSDCTDYNYMVWYYNNISFIDRGEISEDIKPLVDTVVANSDYVCHKDKRGYYSLITKKEYESIKEREEYNNKIASTFKDGYAIVNVTNNWLSDCAINNEYYYKLVTDDDFVFYFKNDNIKYYEGNYYTSGGYKPAIKGKGKNLKNKQVKLYITPVSIHSKDAWYDNKEFMVTDFEIL